MEKTDPSFSFKLGELFCGPGGLALGASSASVSLENREYRVSHTWANDIDLDTCNTYTKNICPDHPQSVLCKDVKALDIATLDPIDIFAYGFPCNDYSIVGEQKGLNGTFGPLYRYGIQVLEIHKPLAFIAENVSGLNSANEGKTLEKILTEMKVAGSGYHLSVHLYKAEDYGVPQSRHRLIIVGISKNLKKHFNVPKPTTKGFPVTAQVALESPPIPECAMNHERTKQASQVVERLKYIRPGENAWTANLPQSLKLKVKGAHLSQIYKRLDPHKPSYTITGSGGGGTHGYHWSEPRALTNRERARLQTFPDSFIFMGSKESVRKQIGMAVPPLLSQHLFVALLKTLLGIPYESENKRIIPQLELFH